MAGCGLSEDACFSSFFYNYTSSWETSYNQVSWPVLPGALAAAAPAGLLGGGEGDACACRKELEVFLLSMRGQSAGERNGKRAFFPCAFPPPSLRPSREEEEREEG